MLVVKASCNEVFPKRIDVITFVTNRNIMAAIFMHQANLMIDLKNLIGIKLDQFNHKLFILGYVWIDQLSILIYSECFQP